VLTLFCWLAAFLDYHDIPYRVVEVNPVGKKELKWSDYKKVPVLVVDGVQLNDSTVIMTTLSKQLKESESLKEEDNSEEEQWRRFVKVLFL
jgi:microsomal prostaglandin-E synthase 2